MTGSDKDTGRSANTIHEVPSFGDRLVNMIRPKNIVFAGEVPVTSSSAGCQRCSQVRLRFLDVSSVPYQIYFNTGKFRVVVTRTH